MISDDKKICEEILKVHGYRVTTGRVAILSAIKKSSKPLTALQLQEILSCDKVTLYRALDDFVHSKIISEVSLKGRALYYEFNHHDHHHHHIVCTRCGVIEDIKDCNEKVLQKTALKLTTSFEQVTSHSLEFFGVCKKCA
jgi:Fe2+ or Zn2+ uptake regulation protein